MNPAKRRGVIFAILAAAFYALNSPLSKLLLQSIPPTMMAAFLYLGARYPFLLVKRWYDWQFGKDKMEMPPPPPKD